MYERIPKIAHLDTEPISRIARFNAHAGMEAFLQKDYPDSPPFCKSMLLVRGLKLGYVTQYEREVLPW